jgi:hypothetical protein
MLRQSRLDAEHNTVVLTDVADLPEALRWKQAG